MRPWVLAPSLALGLVLAACGAAPTVSPAAQRQHTVAKATPKTCASNLVVVGPWTVRTYRNCAQTYYRTDSLIPTAAANPVPLYARQNAAQAASAAAPGPLAVLEGSSTPSGPTPVPQRATCSVWQANLLSTRNTWVTDGGARSCADTLLGENAGPPPDPYVKSAPPSGYLAALRSKEQLTAPPVWAANLFAPGGHCVAGVFVQPEPGLGLDANGNPGAFAAILVRVYPGCEAAFRPLNIEGLGWAPFPRQAPPTGQCAVWISGAWQLKPLGHCAGA